MSRLCNRRRWTAGVVLLAALLGAGCAEMDKGNQVRQDASMLKFLFPNQKDVAPPSDKVAEIRVPFRIGVAFVPDTSAAEFRLPESERQRLAGQVREAFANYPFIREIEVVPSLYLEPGGSFANLDRLAQLLRLDVIALISFDQTQQTEANRASLWYWTGVGAYVVEGDQFDVLTAVETAVFDIPSRRLLMHASGTSTVKGASTLVTFKAKAREARTAGFEQAMQQMIGNLHEQVQQFRMTAPGDPRIHLILPPGYHPASSVPAR